MRRDLFTSLLEGIQKGCEVSEGSIQSLGTSSNKVLKTMGFGYFGYHRNPMRKGLCLPAKENNKNQLKKTFLKRNENKDVVRFY